MIYILKSAIILALLYSCFFFLLSKETFHRFNRCMLLGFMLTSLIAPMFHFNTEHPTIVNEELYEIQTYVEANTIQPLVIPDISAEAPRITWIQIILWLYLFGVAAMLGITLVQLIQLVLIIRKGLRHTDPHGNTVVLLKGDITPFSFFRHIVMSVQDYEQYRSHILTHEQEHIRLGHSYDLLLLEAMKIFQWFNPFAWFISRDLKAIHEYEADQAVILQGIDAKQYQQILVTKAVGNRLQPFTNNLSHGSLKKRIVMMYQKTSNRWLMLKALCAVPFMALALNAFATPNSTDMAEDLVSTLKKEVVPVAVFTYPEVGNAKFDANTVEATTPASTHKPERTANAASPDSVKKSAVSQDDDPVFTVVEEIAQYPGGQAALMQFLSQNLRYPAIAQQNNISGRVIVRFTINKDGSCTDFEVLENASKMPSVATISAYDNGTNSDSQQMTKEEIASIEAAARKALEEEAIRALKQTKNWIPGKQRGKVVRTSMALPITFRLN